MYVGYKRLKIQPFNADGTKLGDLIVIEGNKHEGGTTTAEITGIAKEPATVAASNINYYVAAGGTGEIKVTLGILDLPEEKSNVLSGFRVDSNNIAYAGEDTNPPYCAIEMESEDNGQIALVGFYQGIMTCDKLSLETLDPAKTFTPEADSWEYKPSNSPWEATKGEVMQKFVGDTKEDAEAIKTFEDQLFNPNGSDSGK